MSTFRFLPSLLILVASTSCGILNTSQEKTENDSDTNAQYSEVKAQVGFIDRIFGVKTPAKERTYLWVDQYPTVSGFAKADFNICWYFATLKEPGEIANDNLQRIFLKKAQPAFGKFVSISRLHAVLERQELGSLSNKLFGVFGVHDKESLKALKSTPHQLNLKWDEWSDADMKKLQHVLANLDPKVIEHDTVRDAPAGSFTFETQRCQTTESGKAKILPGSTADIAH